jgi:hypothetical protein
VLLFLKLTLGENVGEGGKLAPTVDIVIGDFAGVENAFECDAVSVSNFLAIQKDVVPRTLYYKYEEGKEGIDIIHGGDGKDDEEKKVKEANNAFANDIYGKLNSLRGGLYKIETLQNKPTTTEFEVNDNTLKEGDIMDYLLTYEGQSLMKVLENKDYTKLQKSLEWVGRHYEEFGNRIENYKSADDGSKKGENYLKITEHEYDIKSLIVSTENNDTLGKNILSMLSELYTLANDDKIFPEKLLLFKKYSKKLSSSANTRINSLQDLDNKSKQDKIQNFQNKAIEIIKLNTTYKLGLNVDNNQTIPNVIFERFNGLLKSKGEKITNGLSKLSNIENIKILNDELKSIINEAINLIHNYKNYFIKNKDDVIIILENIPTNIYGLENFLDSNNNVLITIQDNAYKVNNINFEYFIFDELEETIKKIILIENTIETIESNKKNGKKEIEGNLLKIKNFINDDLNKNIVYAETFIKGINEFISNLTYDNNNSYLTGDNNNNKNIEVLINSAFINDINKINKIIEYKIDNEDFFLLLNEEKQKLLKDSYRIKLDSLKAIFDEDEAKQKRIQDEADRAEILKQLQNIELTITKFKKTNTDPLQININNIELKKTELKNKLNELKNYTQPDPSKTNEIKVKQKELEGKKNISDNLYTNQNVLNINQTNTVITSYNNKITTELQSLVEQLKSYGYKAKHTTEVYSDAEIKDFETYVKGRCESQQRWIAKGSTYMQKYYILIQDTIDIDLFKPGIDYLTTLPSNIISDFKEFCDRFKMNSGDREQLADLIKKAKENDNI